MKRIAILLYGVIVYFIFFTTFLYLIGFVGDLFVPKSLDGELSVPLWQALLTNFSLCALFGLQHSIMARPAFKQWWTKIIPEPMERSTYVLFTSMALIIMFIFWQPMGGILWSVENQTLNIILYSIFATGWLLVLVSTFVINHFDLFGLRQVWLNFRQKPYSPLKFQVHSLYKVVRHPIYLGMVLALWSAPIMSVSRLVLALLLTGYIFIGISYEERDLKTVFGDNYRDYMKIVPKLFPRLFARKQKQPVYESIMRNTQID